MSLNIRIEVDEPVMVRNNPRDEWQKGYFAGVNAFGSALTWLYGATSWSVLIPVSSISSWNECRRPTKEEMNTPNAVEKCQKIWSDMK